MYFLCLGIWWRRQIFISKILKFYFLENEKNFWSEVQHIFPSFASDVFKTN